MRHFTGIIFVAASCISLSHAQVSIEQIVKNVNFEQKLNTVIPLDLSFYDEQGVQIQLGQYFHEGRPVVLVFGYYNCPMLCTRVLSSLVESLKLIPSMAGRDYEVITVSIDPQEKFQLAAAKKSSCLRWYARPGTDDGWHFLTGNEPEISRLAHAAGFNFVHDNETRQFAHPSGIIILTPKGRISQYFPGVDYPTRNIQSAILDASGEKTGTIAEQVLLLCFEYNSNTGKYSFAIIKTLRICAILFTVVLGSYIAWMLRAELRKAPRPASPGGL